MIGWFYLGFIVLCVIAYLVWEDKKGKKIKLQKQNELEDKNTRIKFLKSNISDFIKVEKTDMDRFVFEIAYLDKIGEIVVVYDNDPLSDKIILFPSIANDYLESVLCLSKNHDEVEFSFLFINNEFYLSFRTIKNQISPIEGDKILFLFEDNEKFEFTLLDKSYKIEKNYQNKIQVECLHKLNKNEIQKFTSKSLAKWRFIDVKNDLPFYNNFRIDQIEKAKVLADIICKSSDMI